jgi:polar amino acid transport system substrate-binding protein
MKLFSKTRTLILTALLFTALLAAGLMPSQAVAGKIVDRILERGTLTVGTTGHFPPFSVQDKQGKYIGLDMELAKYMAEAMGVKLDIKRYNMADLLAAVEKGKVDMALSGITMTPQRNLRVIFVGPYTVTGQSILAKRGVVEKIKTPEDMNSPDFKLVVVSGTTGATVAKALVPKAAIIEAKTMTEAFDLVLNNKADALMADQPFCVVSAFQNRDKEIGVSEPFTYEPLGIALPEGDCLLVNWVENFLLKINAVGKLKEMKHYWFSDPSWIQNIPGGVVGSKPSI